MKKYLLGFLFLISGVAGFSQGFLRVATWNADPNTLVINKGGLRNDSLLTIPQYADTVNMQKAKFYNSNLIKIGADLWMRNGTAWVKMNGVLIETDPVFSASPPSGITNTDISNWNTAYGWGNHTGLYPLYNGTGATGTWGISISGNAATVTNGIYSTGSYADPVWLTTLDFSKLFGVPDYLLKSGGTMSGDIVQPLAPTNAFHLTNKSYVDNLITGITWKQSVRVATTSNITLSGLQTIDGIGLSSGNRVLVKNQTTTSENGIYIVSAGAWTRALDADTDAEIETATVFVNQGTANSNTQWTQTTTPVVIGTTAITFGQIAGAGTYTNGAGLNLTGNVFSVASLGITNAMVNDVDWSKITNITGTAPALTAGNATKLTTGRTISATGDMAYTSGLFDGSANVTGVATLATVNSNVGTFNKVTVNAKGLVTAASNATARTHSSVSLAVNTARTPNANRDVQVIITFNLVANDGQTATGNVLVDNSGGGTYQTLGIASNAFSVTGMLGVTGSETIKQAVTFICPIGSQYKWTTTGTGTTTVTSIYELIL